MSKKINPLQEQYVLEIPNKEHLIPYINEEDTLELVVEIDEPLILELLSDGILPYYEGDYSVIPRVYKQVLSTKQHSMHYDVEVEKIPKTETTNIFGKTITIG